MNKEIKIELFNIYAMVVFEDETGITQDCVCVIGKDKEANKIVDIVECNNHSISIYEDGSYKVWEKDGKNMPYYATNKKIIHLYTLAKDNRFCDVYPISDYEAIDNAEPSEAMIFYIDKMIDRNNKYIAEDKGVPQLYINDNEVLKQVKQALLKAQENEKVLEILKPLCEVVETPVKKLRYLKVSGVVVYTFKDTEEFDTLKRYFDVSSK